MRKSLRFFVPVIFLFILYGNSGCVFSQESNSHDEIIARLNQINQRLKTTLSGTEVLKLADEIWPILDEELVGYLGRNDKSSVKEINRELEKLLDTRESADELRSSTGIDLIGVGSSDLFLATYTNLYLPGSVVSTVRVLKKVGSAWRVAGRLEQTALVKSLYPAHREELEKEVKAKRESYHSIRLPESRQLRAEIISSWPIQRMGIIISPQSIRLLPSGDMRFVTLLSTGGTITVTNAVEWEWSSQKGLEAISWVWGEEWTYDENSKGYIGRWHSERTEKKERLVRLKDLFPKH